MSHTLRVAAWTGDGALLTAALAGCASLRVDKAARVATGLTSHLLCEETFIGGRDPALVYAERVQPLPGMGPFEWAMRWRLDPVLQQVNVTLAGGFESQATHRPGYGCVALPVGEPTPALDAAPKLATTPAAQPDIAGPAVVTPVSPALATALERALAPTDGLRHNTQAVLVLRRGRLLGERYAAGRGPDTPMPGFSLTKSVTSALVGILVRQGRIDVQAPAVLAAWQDAADPRRTITVDHLLRQTSGLDLIQNNSGFDPSTQIMYTVRDKARASAEAPLSAPPGARWAYSDTNYLLLARILRDHVGGTAPDVLRFAQQELFGPLGMRHTTLQFDATGTPIGAAHLMASPRDWARFGQLYLDDGMAGATRLLPSGWVRQSATPTLETGYGAGFWTNRYGGQMHAAWGVPWGLADAPSDTFFGRGFMGQYVVLIPSEQLVIVRLSVSHVKGDDIEETNRIVGEIRAALR